MYGRRVGSFISGRVGDTVSPSSLGREGGRMYVTYSDLFQLISILLDVINVTLTIFVLFPKNKKK